MEPMWNSLRHGNSAVMPNSIVAPTQVESLKEPRQAEEISPPNIKGEVISKSMRNVYIN